MLYADADSDAARVQARRLENRAGQCHEQTARAMGSSGQLITAPHSPAQLSTAQHSPAQLSKAPHSSSLNTAQHSNPQSLQLSTATHSNQNDWRTSSAGQRTNRCEHRVLSDEEVNPLNPLYCQEAVLSDEGGEL